MIDWHMLTFIYISGLVHGIMIGGIIMNLYCLRKVNKKLKAIKNDTNRTMETKRKDVS